MLEFRQNKLDRFSKMKKQLVKNNFLITSTFTLIIFLIFVQESYSYNLKIKLEGVSNLPINAYEKKSSIANLVAIIGGKGLKNKHGKSRNFLVRIKDKIENNYLNYYLFPNSTKKEKASYELRVSAERIERILALVKAIKKRNKKPIFIAGFSRGSVDAGKFSKIYPGEISGIILASGIYTNFSKKAEFYSMQLIIGESIKVPTLVIHHTDDNCIATPFVYAKKFFEGLKAPSKTFKAYSGGYTSGGECGPFNYHGFEGIEEKVVDNMVKWIKNISGN